MGGGDFATLDAAREAGAATFAYGSFVMAIINFLIIAFVVFMLVRTINKIKEAAEKKEEAAPEPEADPGPSELDILIEIRDSLKAR
jgi:large conductance mechanosensitive channel